MRAGGWQGNLVRLERGSLISWGASRRVVVLTTGRQELENVFSERPERKLPDWRKERSHKEWLLDWGI